MNKFETLHKVTFEKFPDIHRDKVSGKIKGNYPQKTIENSLWLAVREQGIKISFKDIRIFLNSENIPAI